MRGDHGDARCEATHRLFDGTHKGGMDKKKWGRMRKGDGEDVLVDSKRDVIVHVVKVRFDGR